MGGRYAHYSPQDGGRLGQDLPRNSDLTFLSQELLPSFQLTRQKISWNKSAKYVLYHRIDNVWHSKGTRSHFHGGCAKPQLGEELAHVLYLLSSSSVEVIHLWCEATSSTARCESACARKAISPWLRLGSVGLHPRVCSVTAWAAVGRVGADRVWRRREGSRGVDKRWWRECSSKA